MEFFYFLAIFPAAWELLVLLQTKRVINFRNTIINRREQLHPAPLNIEQLIYPFFHLGYFIWAVIGLFTAQWLSFLVLLALGLTTKHNSPLLLRADALICLLLISSIILNR